MSILEAVEASLLAKAIETACKVVYKKLTEQKASLPDDNSVVREGSSPDDTSTN